MARHLYHGPCPRCGSRDNLSTYDNGSSWCWGCGYYGRGSINPLIKERENEQNQREDADGRGRICLPEDATGTISGLGAEWLSKYRISPVESLRAGWRWSESWQQLLFPFYDKDNKLCCLQARNFDPQRASKAKYYNQGEKAESYTIYQGPRTGELCEYGGSRGFRESPEQITSPVLLEQRQEMFGRNQDFSVQRALVLTEDAVSSLVVARCCDAMPLLGTHIAKEKIMALKGLNRWDSLVVWLDSDKYREARNIADQAKLVGFDAHAEFTELDPKDLSDDIIKEILK